MLMICASEVTDITTKRGIGIQQTNKWQYSPLLRFFVHMMLIIDEKLSIVHRLEHATQNPDLLFE